MVGGCMPPEKSDQEVHGVFQNLQAAVPAFHDASEESFHQDVIAASC